MFEATTPGLLTADPGSARRLRLRSGEWDGTVAVAFTPPPGVTPGVAGTVVDGVTDPHDVSATIVDLAVRGWFTIEEVTRDAGAEAASTGPGRRDRDWMLHRAGTDPAESLTGFEATLVTNLFRDVGNVGGTAGDAGTAVSAVSADEVRLSQLHGSFAMTMREAQIGLYREVVDRGWYLRHPRAKNARARLVGLVVTVPLSLAAIALALRAGLVEGDWSFVPLAVGAVLAGLVLVRWGRARTPRTADGTAVRIQTLGFLHYLETAEADQIRFEEAGALFSRYLPWAMAFGIAEAWVTWLTWLTSVSWRPGWGTPSRGWPAPSGASATSPKPPRACSTSAACGAAATGAVATSEPRKSVEGTVPRMEGSTL